MVFSMLLCQRVDLLGKTRLLTCCSVLVIDVVRSSLIDGLVSRNEEVFRLFCVAGSNSVIDAADGTADACLLRNIACAALGVRLYTQNGCLDVWQIVHPPRRKMFCVILSHRFMKCNIFFFTELLDSHANIL